MRNYHLLTLFGWESNLKVWFPNPNAGPAEREPYHFHGSGLVSLALWGFARDWLVRRVPGTHGRCGVDSFSPRADLLARGGVEERRLRVPMRLMRYRPDDWHVFLPITHYVSLCASRVWEEG